MKPRPQPPKGREEAISALNAAIEVLNATREIPSTTPVKAALGSAGVLLTSIRVGFLLSCNDLLQVRIYLELDNR